MSDVMMRAFEECRIGDSGAVFGSSRHMRIANRMANEESFRAYSKYVEEQMRWAIYPVQTESIQ